MTSCCAIIVTYNGMEWIDTCLGSLENSDLRVDSILVDNGSNDDTVNYVKKQFPKVIILENQQNLGFGAANNLGFKYALTKGYQYLFLLNQDAWVQQSTLGKLVDQIKKPSQNLGIISPTHLNGLGDDLDESFKLYVSEENAPGFLKKEREKTHAGKLYKVPFVNAAAWLMSSDCVKNVGLFHPLFFHYGEDINYTHRVLSKGFDIGILAGVYVYHDREDRSSSSFMIDPKEKIKRDVLLWLLKPGHDPSWLNYFRFVRKRVRKISRWLKLSTSQKWQLWKYMLFKWTRLKKQVDQFPGQQLYDFD